MTKPVSWWRRPSVVFPAALVLIGVLSHLVWFNFGTILNHSDWTFWGQQAIKELWYSWGSWLSFNGFGAVNIQIPFLGFNLVWSLFGLIGWSYDAATKVTFMIPIAVLGFIAPYVLFRYLLRHEAIAFCAALYYGTAIYFLVKQTAHLPIALVYALAPLVLWAFLRALERSTAARWISFGLLYTVSIIYEVRITFVVTLLLAGYLLGCGWPWLRRQGWWLIFGGTVVVGLNLFWLLPTVLGGGTQAIAGVADRGLFGNQLFDLVHAFTAMESSWTGALPRQDFVMQDVMWYLWLVPLLAWSVLLQLQQLNRRERVWAIFWAVLTLAGIFLTKQADLPLAGAYEWMYNHVPGFSLFREASKFYLLSDMGYAGLLGLALVAWWRWAQTIAWRRWAVMVAGVGVVGLSLFNLWPLVNGRIGTMFTPRHMPADYVTLNAFLQHQNDYFRTYWVPRPSRWNAYSNLHPQLSSVDAVGSDWKDFDTASQSGGNESSQQAAVAMLRKPYAADLLNRSSVKYLIVPSRDTANEDDFFQFYGDDRQFFLHQLDALPFLKRIDIGTKEVVVYQNVGYKAYVSAPGSVIRLPDMAGLERTLGFAGQQLGKSFDFVAGAVAGTQGATGVQDIFAALTRQSMSPGKLTQTINPPGDQRTLYLNTDHAELSYQVQQGRTLVVSRQQVAGLQVNGRPVEPAGSSTTTVARVILLAGAQYYMQYGQTLLPVDSGDGGVHPLGALADALTLVRVTPANQVNNPSLEQGLWQTKVSDCNAYDSFADISMDTSDDATDGRQSLELDAGRHTACTGPAPLAVTAGTNLVFSFDYRVLNGLGGGYRLSFNDAAKTVISDQLTGGDNSWRQLSRTVTVPAGATSLAIQLLATPNDRTPIRGVVRYDNLAVRTIASQTPLAAAAPPSYQSVGLPAAGPLRFTYADASFDYRNLLPNPSFEQGLWRDKVGDCYNYDDHPDIKMSLNHQVHSDGDQSLQLEARRHVACTGLSDIPVVTGGTYLLSFDYQSPNATTGRYYMSFNDPKRTVMSDWLPIKDQTWQTLTRTVSVPAGATSATLFVYAYPDETNGAYVINRYDNFSLTRVPDLADQYYLVDAPSSTPVSTPAMSWTAAGPTQKQLHIQGARGTFYVAMSEAYNPHWQLAGAGGGRAIPAASHLKLNDFENGWYIDVAALCQGKQSFCHRQADGSYNLELLATFTPQRYFYAGAAASGLTLVACLGYLAWAWRRRRTKA